VRVRTVYFKVRRLEDAAAFWGAFLGTPPVRSFPEWVEFRVGEVNLGLLRAEAADRRAANPCVPVFEVADAEVDACIQRAKDLGATVLLGGEDHPDYPRTAAVLRDPFGNEFEVTNLHD
jgi:catechol 2,3-dioxygenase-like lactoylglutathione lyase family enzyme